MKCPQSASERLNPIYVNREQTGDDARVRLVVDRIRNTLQGEVHRHVLTDEVAGIMIQSSERFDLTTPAIKREETMAGSRHSGRLGRSVRRITRRKVLKAGCLGHAGLTLPMLFLQRASAATPIATPSIPQVKSLILVFLEGGISHIDSLDIKPYAPSGFRGEFEPISTSIPGVQFCEHLPQLAARANQFALVRSMAHRDEGHPSATHKLITGSTLPNIPEDVGVDKHAGRDDAPCYAAALDHLRPRGDGLPSGVHAPVYIRGAFNWPGQNAGFLGPRHDPLQINNKSDNFDYSQKHMSLDEAVGRGRFKNRRELLGQLDQQRRQLDEHAATSAFSEHQQGAFSVLNSPKLAQAFETDREPKAVGDRYGRHDYGQSLLLARRLVQAGVRVVQANLRGWDTHYDGFKRLKQQQFPKLDVSLSALMDDLSDHGMLRDTLVIVTSEFGRTPQINTPPAGQIPGRDHWAGCYSALFAGGGVEVGQVIGASNSIASYPTTKSFSPSDLGATLYTALGVDPATEIHDRVTGRPYPLNRGKVIRELYT